MNPDRPYTEFSLTANTLTQPYDSILHRHPTLDFSQATTRSELAIAELPRRLYLVPTRDDYPGSDYDPDLLSKDAADFIPPPEPTPEVLLPNVEDWITRYTYSVVEIWNGKRPAMQLARWSHRRVYTTLVTQVGAFTPAPKIRRVHIHRPIEGVAESVVLLRIGNRVRSLILRFEGVDNRWVCTQMWLL
jgi:hypothetical protein